MQRINTFMVILCHFFLSGVLRYSRERNELYFFTTKYRIKGSQWVATGKTAEDIRGANGQILGTKRLYRHKNNYKRYKWYLDVYQMPEHDMTMVKFYESSRGEHYSPPPMTQEQFRQSVAYIVRDTLSRLGYIPRSSIFPLNAPPPTSMPSASSGTGSMIPTPGISQQAQSGIQSLGANSSSVSNPLSQQASSARQSAQSQYAKFWEGNLSFLGRRSQPVSITRLEGYRRASASETLAANWPPTLQIVRLIPQEPLNNR
uniref:uncharacterized protein LOC105351413 isoform X2 n=1 Tax=Fragaria vesca subsp. vesca TaxID=101020 RepID=UPI0005CA5269|nr:PREDICTED: uncharacterized protein LOC105351413 isoform X2 [Fragaria vesca subsp. vesca]